MSLAAKAARDICLSSQPVFFSQITLTNRIYLYKIIRNSTDQQKTFPLGSNETTFITLFKTVFLAQLVLGKPSYKSEFKSIQAYSNRLGYCPSQTFQTC